MQVVRKVLTMQDVEALNADPNASVVLDNTAGQSAEIISKLKPHVSIQIIGGYDGSKKAKYQQSRIQKRTMYTPEEVGKIITRFEELEAGIDPTWSDLEKAAYMYIALGSSIKYHEGHSEKSRNLNVVLGQGVCAGYAIVFKEAMDRLGIECDIINKTRTHTWNAIKLNGTWYPVDLTWDAEAIQKGETSLPWFAQVPTFNKYKDHVADGEAIIPNNCLDPQEVTDAFNKVTRSNHYQPIRLYDKPRIAHSRLMFAIDSGQPKETIIKAMHTLGEQAFTACKGYDEEVYTREFDERFLEVFRAIKKSPSLTDEEKGSILGTTRSLWLDVARNQGLVRDTDGEIHSHLYYIASAKPDFDYSTFNYSLLEAQKREILNQCRTYGVIDIDKMIAAEGVLRAQFDAICSKRQSGEEITAEDTAIVIESPVEVTVCERHEFNIEKWATEVVADQEAFVAGLEASGASTEDEETQEIIAICKGNIQNLKDNVLAHAQHATNDTEERQDK